MGMPVTTQTTGICYAFPNVCTTDTPGGPVPIPYPSIGQLSDADPVTNGATDGVFAARHPLVTVASRIPTTSGDEAAQPGTKGGPVTFPSGSSSVFANGHAVVRLLDPTEQNNGNARGTVLAGVSSVMAGG
jgi:Domain of unknown function (DUF4150)